MTTPGRSTAVTATVTWRSTATSTARWPGSTTAYSPATYSLPGACRTTVRAWFIARPRR